MTYKKDHFKHPSTGDMRVVSRGFSWTALFLGFLVPLFKWDLKWLFIHLFITLSLTGVLPLMGIPGDLVQLLYISWNSIFACYYNSWYRSDLIKKGYEITLEGLPRRLKKIGKTDLLTYKFTKYFKRQVSKSGFSTGNIHLNNMIIVFFIVIVFYIFLPFFSGVTGTGSSIVNDRISATLKSPEENSLENYYNLVAGEITYINKIQSNHERKTSLTSKLYSEKSYAQDISSIRQRIKHLDKATVPEGFQDIHEDLKNLYLLFGEVLRLQSIAGTGESTTTAVHYKYQYFKEEDIFIDNFMKRLMERDFPVENRGIFHSGGK